MKAKTIKKNRRTIAKRAIYPTFQKRKSILLSLCIQLPYAKVEGKTTGRIKTNRQRL
jgi:hypothetical protein